MFDTSREIVGYLLIAAIFLVGTPWLGLTLARRKREKLRRRGIKRYGH